MVSCKNNITPTATAEFLIQHFHNFSVPVQNAQDRIGEYAKNLVREQGTALLDQVRYFRTVTANRLDHIRNDLVQVSGNFRHSSANYTAQRKSELDHHRIHLANNAGRIMHAHSTSLNNKQQLLDLGIRNRLQSKISEIEKYEKFLVLVHPANVLKRGYSITYVNGKLLLSGKEASVGDELTTELFKGKIKSKIISKEP